MSVVQGEFVQVQGVSRMHGAAATLPARATGDLPEVPARRRRRRLTLAHPAAPVHNPRPSPGSGPLPTGAPSLAGGEWRIDHAAAARFAAKTLAEIDFSKRDIVLFVSGTADKGVVPKIDPQFTAAAYTAWRDGGLSLNLMRYESSWNVRDSVATGIQALRLVMQELGKYRPKHRILLAGLSQGAWVLGEALADPKLRGTYDRAVLMGHPSVGKHHFHDGTDGKILEINDPWDRVAMPLRPGTEKRSMEAFIALRSLNPSHLPMLAGALTDNPKAGALSLLATIRDVMPITVIKGMIPEPHDYTKYMLRGAYWLFAGRDVAPGGDADESHERGTEATRPPDPASAVAG